MPTHRRTPEICTLALETRRAREARAKFCCEEATPSTALPVVATCTWRAVLEQVLMEALLWPEGPSQLRLPKEAK